MGSSNCKSKKAKGHKLNSPLQSGSLDRPFPRANSIPIQPNKVISDVLLNEKKFHQQHIDVGFCFKMIISSFKMILGKLSKNS